ncbi:glycosyltransferase [Amycolatopsis pigmentata]|uniref:Glycosyltransferase n=1 Tax=Amycolatopsis pigmentata TaxID=450801 RepID=A0ABW5G5G9_9PSEU
MRVLFCSLPAYGHIYPSIPLALATRDAGHEVVYATDSSSHQSLEAFALDVAQVGISVRQAFVEASGGAVHPSGMSPERQAELTGTVFGSLLPRAFFADLGPLLERMKPDLVVNMAANFGAFLAAKHAGIPSVWHSPGWIAYGEMGASLPAQLTATANDVGVEYTSGFNPYTDSPLLDIRPASLQDEAFLRATNPIPLRPVPISEPGDLPSFVTDRVRSRPLIYLTLGTVFGAVPVLRQAIEGLATLDADVIVAAGPSVDVAALGPIPDRVRVVGWVPQADLLPHVDLVVHHGGSGTMLGALAAGVPQLVLPQGADQFGNAEAVETTRAGAAIRPAELTADSVATKAKRLLSDDAARAAARTVAAEIAAMPSPEATVDVLSQLAS